MDHRGTTFTYPLLRELLAALSTPSTGPCLGKARFDEATFIGEARFDKATFIGEARFDKATFTGEARFDKATFTGEARFIGTTFTRAAWFDGATFAAHATFGSATFTGMTRFVGATFAADAWFVGVDFTTVGRLGPLTSRGCLDISGARFGNPVTIEAAAGSVRCTRTQWDATANLHLRYARVDLSYTVVTHPIAVTAKPAPFIGIGGARLSEQVLTATVPGTPPDPRVRIVSLRGVDAAHLVLTDTDLTNCVFTGTFHLDQLRLEGDTLFAEPPTGRRLRRGIPARLTRRRTIAEEHRWRALAPGNPPSPHGWTQGPSHPNPALTPGPEDVGPIYRALRKASEDAKNEPDAADFYYGELEMRRHDRKRPAGERALITTYWLLSGYGLRASRALGWLLLAMAATITAMMLWGLPTHDPEPHIVGVQPQPGQQVNLVTTNPDPSLTGPLADRFTTKRAEKATRVVLNSVVFRSSDQNLTRRGTYIEMTSRFFEPVLLALAVLAIRGRVKR
ncbi:pentapeptide repeat-containing protein [Streptomyces sp. NPDC056930]|uniref:pentapeptide repeat-containing protein n=1 Tax=Streptomyces sp. NPDC056930 TaxID=3345967 RepID=UPI00362B1498